MSKYQEIKSKIEKISRAFVEENDLHEATGFISVISNNVGSSKSEIMLEIVKPEYGFAEERDYLALSQDLTKLIQEDVTEIKVIVKITDKENPLELS